MGLIIKEPLPQTPVPHVPLYDTSPDPRCSSGTRSFIASDLMNPQCSTQLVFSSAMRIRAGRKVQRISMGGNLFLEIQVASLCVFCCIPAEVFVKQLYSQCQLQPTIFLPLDWKIVSTWRDWFWNNLLQGGKFTVDCVREVFEVVFPSKKSNQTCQTFTPFCSFKKGPQIQKENPDASKMKFFFNLRWGVYPLAVWFFPHPKRKAVWIKGGCGTIMCKDRWSNWNHNMNNSMLDHVSIR